MAAIGRPLDRRGPGHHRLPDLAGRGGRHPDPRPARRAARLVLDLAAPFPGTRYLVDRATEHGRWPAVLATARAGRALLPRGGPRPTPADPAADGRPGRDPGLPDRSAPMSAGPYTRATWTLHAAPRLGTAASTSSTPRRRRRSATPRTRSARSRALSRGLPRGARPLAGAARRARRARATRRAPAAGRPTRGATIRPRPAAEAGAEDAPPSGRSGPRSSA